MLDFVNAAHKHGLAVILDVVYNHFGPVGNFLGDFAPPFFGKPGEWGDTISYDAADSGPVRAFVIENAAYWISEFHFDGLRFDATHGIFDTSAEHVVSEMCAAARAAAGGRRLFLVGENESQDTQLLRASGVYRDGLDAIWNEDWHHAAFVALTGRREAQAYQLSRDRRRIRVDGAPASSTRASGAPGRSNHVAVSRSASAAARSSAFWRITIKWPIPVLGGASSRTSTRRSGEPSLRCCSPARRFPCFSRARSLRPHVRLPTSRITTPTWPMRWRKAGWSFWRSFRRSPRPT